MNKVICDVCGTDYPETAAQCPICGCARSDGGQTSAGNAVPSDEEQATYTYVKGGRFSKSNVRKRLKNSEEPEVATPAISFDDEDDQEDDIPDDEQEPTSNRALIVIVILLLLAIIAVSSYIAITFFGLGSDKDSDTTKNTGTSQNSTAATGDSTPVDPNAKPCTGLTLTQSEVILSNTTPYQIPVTVEPADTTDKLVFKSSDEKIATVDAKGNVTAVGEGEATITITCGSFNAECKVVSEVKTTVDPTDPTDPTDPVDPTDPTDPVNPVELKLNRQDITFSYKGEKWKLYTGDVDVADITFTSDNEEIATFKDGVVVAVGPGTTDVHAEYEGQKVSCIIRCAFKAEPEEPENPEEPAEVYSILIDGNLPHFTMPGNPKHSASVTIKKGESFSLSFAKLADDKGDEDPKNDVYTPVQGVEWTIKDGTICSKEDRKVTGLAAGNTLITTTYEGQEYVCQVFVTDPDNA